MDWQLIGGLAIVFGVFLHFAMVSFNFIIAPSILVFLTVKIPWKLWKRQRLKGIEIGGFVLSSTCILVQLTYGFYSSHMICDGQCGTDIQKPLATTNSVMLERTDRYTGRLIGGCVSVCAELLTTTQLDFIEIRYEERLAKPKGINEVGNKRFSIVRVEPFHSQGNKCKPSKNRLSTQTIQLVKYRDKNGALKSLCVLNTKIDKPLSDYLVSDSYSIYRGTEATITGTLISLLTLGTVQVHEQVTSNIQSGEIIKRYKLVNYKPRKSNLGSLIGEINLGDDFILGSDPNVDIPRLFQ